ncbi:N/A [soil metagenome]
MNRRRHAARRPALTVLTLLILAVSGAAGPATAQVMAQDQSARDATAAAPPVEPPVLDEKLGELEEGLYEGTGVRDLRSYRPDPSVVMTDRRELKGTDRWAINVRREGIALLRGARRVAWVPMSTPGVATLPEITEAIDDPRWIEEVDDGVFLLRAALVHGSGTRLKIAGPRVREMRLADRPDVFLLGAKRAQAEIRDTRVVGWDERRDAVDADHEFSRPFILYTNGARLDIVNSEIAYLGYDRTSAYGLSWRKGGATGSVTNSDVHHLLFGMYSFEAADIELRDSKWHDCVYYGIDPHDFSTGMVVEGNTMTDNGSHGLIFSKGVTGGLIRNNRIERNAGNGIVMDFVSDGALIVDNEVNDNKGDGIVILGSSAAHVADNRVSGNRIGLRVNLRARRNVFERNHVVGNRVGAQIYDGARATSLRDNTFRDSTNTGVVLNGAQTRLQGGEISGSGVGVDVRGVATADGVSISDVDRGIEVRDVGILRARNLRIDAEESGVQAAPGSLTRIFDSQIDAPEPVTGALRAEEGNELRVPLAALWLVLAGVAFLVIAVLLHLVHQLRNRRYARVRRPPVAPPGVTNVR